MIITADHGNAEQMIDAVDGRAIYVTHHLESGALCRGDRAERANSGCEIRNGGVLADVAPTILSLMGDSDAAGNGGKGPLSVDCRQIDLSG